MVLAFPAGAGIETPGIPDGNPGIEAFLSFAMTSNINWIKIIIIIIIIINDHYHYYYYYYYRVASFRGNGSVLSELAEFIK